MQSSSWSTAQSLRCVINLAVAPAPWLDWIRERRGPLPKQVTESLGLYRDRLHPVGTPAGADGWWQVSSDSDARTAAADMVTQLADHGWPLLTRLLNRHELLDSIRSGDLGHMKGEHDVFFARAEAVLISLDRLRTELESGKPEHMSRRWRPSWPWPPQVRGLPRRSSSALRRLMT